MTAVVCAAIVSAGLLASVQPSFGATPVPAAATRPLEDLMLVVDGGRADSASWAVQRAGIGAALRDPVAFPLDGTMAVGVVQYVAGTLGERAKVEVPLTVLDSPEALERVVASVTAMVPLVSGGSSLDGLAAAGNHLAQQGRSGTQWATCLIPRNPWGARIDFPTALTRARAVGVDRTPVLGIADRVQGDFLRTSFDLGPKPADSVTIASGAAEFSTLLASACLDRPASLRALEVNQVIQDWSNSVPLIENKATVVRLFLETAETYAVRTSAQLRGFRGGVELTGSPLSPVNPTASVQIDQDANARRGDLDSSLNFLLPKSWLSGDVVLRATHPKFSSCGGLRSVGWGCETTVTFHPSTPPKVAYYTVRHTSGSTQVGPSTSEMWEQMVRTRDLYPVSRIDYDFRTLAPAFTQAPTFNEVNSQLASQRLADGCLLDPEDDACADWAHGVILESPEPYSGMAIDIPGTASSSILISGDSNAGPTGAYGYIRNVTPHEILHAIGSHHSVNAAINGFTEEGYKKGFCTEVASGDAPDFPWFASIGDLGNRATLGPMGDPQTEVWGINPRFLNVDDALALSNPSRIFPTMAYCRPLDDNQGKWMGLTTYELLLEEFAPEAAEASDLRSAHREAVHERVGRAEGSSLVIRGSVDFANPQVSTLQTAYTLEGVGATTSDGAAEWEVRLVDRGGKVLAAQRFTPARSEADIDPARPQGPPTTGLFMLAFPDATRLMASLARVELAFQGVVLATRTASAKAPSVTITRPVRGSRIDKANLTVTWAARDKDGDPLEAVVQWRPNPQSPWTTLAVDAKGGELDVPREDLAGTSAAQVRVIVSDGLRTAMAASAVFVIAENSSRIVITDPAGPRSLTGHQLITLRASTYDPEDGPDAGVITWFSTRNGNLGQGDALDVTADQLAEGTHSITAVVKDAAGKSSRSAPVTIQVTRVPTYS